MKNFVHVSNLTKYYGSFCAVDNLSFDVYEGETFGFLGPNGAGKSTTLSIISTLLDYESGTVIVNNKDLKKDKGSIQNILGWIPQDVAFYSHLNALENVQYFASLYGLKGKEVKRAAIEALDFVGLTEQMKKKPSQMSGGMKRRLNIACGIAHNPKLIIMDEPTVGVDAQSRDHILNSIKVLKKRGATVIYTSHYMQEVEEICDRIAIIDRGKLLVVGAFEELISKLATSKPFTIATDIKSEDISILKKQILACTGIQRVDVTNKSIRLEVNPAEENISHIIRVIVEQGIPIIDICSDAINLETIFLTLTNHELR